MDNKLECDVLLHIGYILTHVEGAGRCSVTEGRKAGNALFNDALNTKW